MTDKIDEKLTIKFYFVLEVLNATGFLTRKQKPDLDFDLKGFNERDAEVYNRARSLTNRLLQGCVNMNYEAGYFLHLYSKVRKGTYDAFDLLEAVSLYKDILKKLEKAEKKEEEKRENNSKNISKFIDEKIRSSQQNSFTSSQNIIFKSWDSSSTSTYDYINLK